MSKTPLRPHLVVRTQELVYRGIELHLFSKMSKNFYLPVGLRLDEPPHDEPDLALQDRNFPSLIHALGVQDYPPFSCQNYIREGLIVSVLVPDARGPLAFGTNTNSW